MKSIYGISFFTIFIFSAIYVFNHEKYSKRIQIIDGYTVPFSVNKGEVITFYLNAQKEHKKGVVCIYNINNQIVDSVVIHLKPEILKNDSLSYELGYRYINQYNYSTSKLPSGLYFFGKVVPFLVKDANIKDNITVVFPFGNFMALNNAGGKSFVKNNSNNGIPAEKLSLQRPSLFRNDPFYFLNWIDSLYGKERVNYISDIDLDNSDILHNTKILLLYGYQAFWTVKGRKNLDKFIDEGGNLLAIGNKIINNRYLFDSKSQQIIFRVPIKIDSCINKSQCAATWSSFYPNYKTIGCSYEIINACDEKYLKSCNCLKFTYPIHEIFKGIEKDAIDIQTQEGNTVKISSIDGNGEPCIDKAFTKFKISKILAFDYIENKGKCQVTGIFNFKKSDLTGEIIVIGNERWGYPENLKRSEISAVTKNCINYLYSSSTIK